ncbi:MAG: hypothetical protein RIE73_15915 [Coleofasciculus sp. C1-SOL-03]
MKQKRQQLVFAQVYSVSQMKLVGCEWRQAGVIEKRSIRASQVFNKVSISLNLNFSMREGSNLRVGQIGNINIR